jgi:hypothetical protein
MNCSTGRIEQEYSVTGVLYDVGSVYDGLSKLTDERKARGKLYRLETVLMIIVMAKLCGADTLLAITDWGKNHAAQIAEWLHLERATMPSYSTYWRIMAHKVYRDEIEMMVAAYNQQGKHGEVYALDGKALRGVRKKDEERASYLLSICDVKQLKVLSQEEVEQKENEISQAPQALKSTEISQKVVTGDALHAQKALSAQILAQGGDYVFPVKENQERLLTLLKKT